VQTAVGWHAMGSALPKWHLVKVIGLRREGAVGATLGLRCLGLRVEGGIREGVMRLRGSQGCVDFRFSPRIQ
jgi:hypothetical protein